MLQRKAAAEKLLLLGVDGLDPRLTRKYVDKGLMPNVKQYIDRGAFTFSRHPHAAQHSHCRCEVDLPDNALCLKAWLNALASSDKDWRNRRIIFTIGGG